MGNGTPTVTLKQEREKVTGHYQGSLGEGDLEGTVKGNAITFSLKLNAQGMDLTITYAGTVEKESMKGTVQFGELGPGSFTAKKR
jgi:hypothetical protein